MLYVMQYGTTITSKLSFLTYTILPIYYKPCLYLLIYNYLRRVLEFEIHCHLRHWSGGKTNFKPSIIIIII